MRAQTVTACPSGNPDVIRETLIPLAVRTRVELAPGTNAINVWPGPIVNTGLVPDSEPPATTGLVLAIVRLSARMRLVHAALMFRSLLCASL